VAQCTPSLVDLRTIVARDVSVNGKTESTTNDLPCFGTFRLGTLNKRRREEKREKILDSPLHAEVRRDPGIFSNSC
jgi:hypothetical protein